MDIENTQHKLDWGKIKINEGKHRDKNVIWLSFIKDFKIIEQIKQMLPAKWSQSKKCWYVFDNRANRFKLGLEDKPIGTELMNSISPVNKTEFEKFLNMLTLKAYSANTVRSYSTEFAQLLQILKNIPVSGLSPQKLQSYFLYCIKVLNLSENTVHSRINAVKFYYEQVLHKDKMFIDIPRPKIPLQLPKALNKREVQKIFEVTQNSKHRLILKLCYGMGLRVSEIINLKIEHIDSERMVVLVKNAKGKKDRMVKLPESVLEELRSYYKEYLPKIYLFEGSGGMPYSIRSVQNVFKLAMNKARIRKRVGIHGLRHSYATHLLETGTDISLIQKLLGHNQIKTTLIYTQIADKQITGIRSPLDNL
ncbi:MAG: tyrosine-type recombinase/integrase [Bacteroidetes bacterium]|nr:tyrosine-type recombinase/integrase [Bacteroidota bacterium]